MWIEGIILKGLLKNLLQQLRNCENRLANGTEPSRA